MSNLLCEPLRELLASRQLHVLFQPIADVAEGGVFGYEALIRGPSDSPLHSPLTLFDTAMACGALSELDHLCRRLAIERFGQLDLPGRLFLNVTPETITQADGPRGRTLQFLEAAGVSPERVVIELTEHTPIKDYRVMQEAVGHYREMGFAIAIDDLGSGYGGLRHWTELRPEYVKIDGHFAQNIHEDPVKRQFVRSMREIAKELDSHLVVEGIETREEYAVIASLGIELAQGYYLQRPTQHPPRSLPQLGGTCRVPAPRHRAGTARGLLHRATAISPATPLPSVVELFQREPQLRSVVVADGDRPVGIVRRHQIMDFYARRYVRELNARKPIRGFMDGQPLMVSQDTPLEQLSQLVTSQIEDDWDRDFIITDEQGRYLGLGTVIDLLRRLTELQIQYARYANPLTQLPGSVPVNEQIDIYLDRGIDFVVAYCDMDSFKPYNDYYGYARGDHVIREMGRLLSESIDPRTDFVGHVGGDDFVLVLASASWLPTLEAVLARFESLAPSFYDDTEREAGGILAPDRQGRELFHELLSLSIGVVQISSGAFMNHHEVAARASEVKCMAKRSPGNSLFIDRRVGGEETVESCAELVYPAASNRLMA
ncbi:diguanylate cyclase [Acidihalobacter yilgarnensis]|uniref:Diguanylate cyclase n=1 Tax=Acidihalobacter yilgarnensis TaxID=2819280 RepID=A0A1D8IQQ7_9GAMM|nr:GGDEF domain-containing protein [Acidihalobacter yilgarnensis]AOU98735.1 diguanylate cyclase [Acidihalobacter yilgarnensis]